MFIENFNEKAMEIDPNVLDFGQLETLQVNVGNKCNQLCQHCHLNASPGGDKLMTKQVIGKIIDFLKKYPGLTLDITGGSPELNPYFKFLVEKASEILSHVMVRTNLTVFFEEGMDDLPGFYQEHGVVVISSLPCYLQENVDAQRGTGVYEKSIKALKKLNELGYGDSLELNLVYNPGGAFLPPDQKDLEKAYKKYIMENFGIRFNNLFTIVNAPLGRFRKRLDANGEYEKYLQLLEENYNPGIVPNIMCRNLVSVDYRGVLYNCDFNQAVNLPIKDDSGEIITIDNLEELIKKGFKIETADHCYCCTAGSGSSCTGALE
ncbi:MAG: arsenosugar biosynthesis radical SAM protein ArsS [Candidatus Aminicenantes bacterium]|nr:MAG: arsenosugar biosynthesis radical SAM protein ArsS [Candidatus Aminicenantes bacterium]